MTIRTLSDAPLGGYAAPNFAIYHLRAYIYVFYTILWYIEAGKALKERRARARAHAEITEGKRGTIAY